MGLELEQDDLDGLTERAARVLAGDTFWLAGIPTYKRWYILDVEKRRDAAARDA